MTDFTFTECMNTRVLKRLKSHIDDVLSDRKKQITDVIKEVVTTLGYTIKQGCTNELIVTGADSQYTIEFSRVNYTYGGNVDGEGYMIPHEPFTVYKKICDCTSKKWAFLTIADVVEFLRIENIPTDAITLKLENMIALCDYGY
jgi:hypothetical protein